MIKLLPDETCNYICAGDAIQHPASIVKELIENAIDAGATSIDINLQNGGKSCIQVTDNGSGMSYEEVLLAFERHATSKIERISDLYNLSTLGFRGEALASISAISDILLKTRPHNHPDGIIYNSKCGSIKGIETADCSEGTDIVVRDIFTNIPFRRRFLKKYEVVENQRSISSVKRLALAYPNIAFTLTIDNQTVLQFHETNQRQRIIDVIGKEIDTDFFYLSTKTGDYELTGYISVPSKKDELKNMRLMTINNRPVVCYPLHKEMQRVYNIIFPDVEEVNYILFFTIPSEEVDVNIRPDKSEANIYDLQRLSALIADAFSTIPSNTRLKSNVQCDNSVAFESYISHLDEELTFDNFFDSKANCDATDIAKSYITQSAGSRYYPLMLVGNHGCGKTHLTNAIANQLLDINPSAKIAAFKVENLEILMAEVERSHKYSEFSSWLTGNDLIIFEDIHKFQEHPLLARQMIWHINSLLHARKKIVFTSRCLPDEINNIEDRLRSRLKSCLILNLS